MTVLVVLTVTAVLIVLNGLFVAAEFAIIGASRPALQRRAEGGDRRARRVLTVLSNPRMQDRYIATAQLGITFASLGLGMYAEHHMAAWILAGLGALGAGSWWAAHGLASGIAIAGLTYLHIVLGEMVPKSLALQSADQTAMTIDRLMRTLKILLYPLVIALNGLGNGLLRLLGIRREMADERYSSDELAEMVRESDHAGLLGQVPGRIARELFEFFDMTAEQVMVPRVQLAAIPLGATAGDLTAILRREPHTRYPVFEGNLDNLVGSLHVKDVLRAIREGRAVDRSRLGPLPRIPGSLPLYRALQSLREARAQLLVVLDEFGGTAGILTFEDIAEELTGELDEEAGGQPEIRATGGGSLIVEGTARLAEVGEALGRKLEHEDVETVSGLVLHLLGRPAAAGDSVAHEGLVFDVLTTVGSGIATCRIAPASEGASRM